MSERQSQQFTRFVAALRALCRQHGVVLSCSMYDTLQVWKAADPTLDSEVLPSGIEDRTPAPEVAAEAAGVLSPEEERIGRRLSMESPS